MRSTSALPCCTRRRRSCSICSHRWGSPTRPRQQPDSATLPSTTIRPAKGDARFSPASAYCACDRPSSRQLARCPPPEPSREGSDVRKSLIVSGFTLISALLLGACSGNDPAMPGMSGMSSSPSAAGAAEQSGHNADDVSFTQQMIPHHNDVVTMAKLVPSRSSNPKIVDLASRIEKGQSPEVQQMQGWLTTWNASMSMPGMSSGAMPGMDGGTMPGMMSADDMKMLEQAQGTEFDKMWLDMMTKHHRGAIDMAKTELGKGVSPDAKALAQKIIDAQQGEIAEMQGLLSQS